jgi:hypothetical protein
MNELKNIHSYYNVDVLYKSRGDLLYEKSVSTLEPMTELQQKNLKQKIKKSFENFYKGLIRSKPEAPSFFRLMLFRMT